MKRQLEEISKEFLEGSLQILESGQEYLELIKNPKYGYGKNMNPCIDCKIFMFKKAKDYMREKGFSFLVTGEVLGERPMSQNLRALKLIEKEAGLERLILRPLSAKLLPVTIPEEAGWVRRKNLLALQGRSRRIQLELASKFNLKDFPTPSGGCLLTDHFFSKRVRDLVENKPDFNIREVGLLKLGRHFRITKRLKLILGRDREENEKLQIFFNPDTDAILSPLNSKGPLGLALGEEIEKKQFLLAEIVAAYSKFNYVQEVKIGLKYKKKDYFFKIKPQEREVFSKLKV